MSGPQTAEGIARALLERIEHGGAIPDEVRVRLLEALSRGAVPSTTIAPVSPQVSEPAVEHASAWADAFERKVSQDEIALLSEEERRFIGEVSEKLKGQLLGFRVAASKPLGAKLPMYEEDYSGFDLSGNVDFKNLADNITNHLSDNLRDLAGSRWRSRNTVHVFDHPKNRNWAVVQCLFISPNNTNPVDNRDILNNYALLVAKGDVLSAVLSPDHLRLLPFIIKKLGMSVSNDQQTSGLDRRVFFDASLAGEEPFGKHANPIALIDYPRRTVMIKGDTRNNSPAEIQTCISDAEFFEAAKRGRDYDSRREGRVNLYGLANRPKKDAYKRAG